MIPLIVVKNLRVTALSCTFFCAVLLASCTSSSQQSHTESSPDKICTGAAGEIPGETCMPVQVSANKGVPCRQEGESFEGKSLGEACCSGLTPIDSTYPSPQVKCMRSAPPSVMICAQCGNNVCGKGENWCNCPADCKNPAKL